MKLSKVLTSLLAVGILGGCQLTPEQQKAEEIVSEWSHRPIIDKLEELPSKVPVLIQDGNQVARSYEADKPREVLNESPISFASMFDFSFGEEESEPETATEAVSAVASALNEEHSEIEVKIAAVAKSDPITISEKIEAEKEHERFNAKLRDGVEESYVAQSSTYILEQESTYEFMAFAGESYGSVLSRWLSEQGYGAVGWYLEDVPRAVVESLITESVHLEMTLDDAITQLFVAMKSSEVVFEDELLDPSVVEDIFVEVRLDADNKNAVVTSSKMPTTLFMVEPGSLKKNFVRLGEHFGWNVAEEFYIAKDYKVSFGFPIVAEKGNVKVALEQLLSPFTSLRGALVPSVREVYVVQEKR
ncbi:hypothetical protein [Vibrio owensii]|uniref:hypothetical protein n=1 Tax=Vibrio owensii TaxID=696485 RepID=UPI0018F26BA2|nr:hypothetical protein [Vibrio owensii]